MSPWIVGQRLLSVVCIMLPVFFLQPAVVHAGDVSAGAALYETTCISCHGEGGDGNGVAADDFVLKPRPFAQAAFKFDTDADWESGSDADLMNVIKNGTAAYGGSAMMPPWSGLADSDIENLIAYIRSLEAVR